MRTRSSSCTNIVSFRYCKVPFKLPISHCSSLSRFAFILTTVGGGYLSSIADKVVLQNECESECEGMMRWKLGVFFLRLAGTRLRSPFSSFSVILEGALKGEEAREEWLEGFAMGIALIFRGMLWR